METVTGYVESIIFRNQENSYTVLELVQDGESHTLVGVMPEIEEGYYIEAHGNLAVHSVYGEQMNVESYEQRMPQDEASIERYLASGVIKGIGTALAARIVKKFGADTFRIIEEEPERLAEIKGISSRIALEIASQAAEKRDLRQAMLFLQNYGISLNLSKKIFEHYGMQVYNIITENPYQLADDITGVGFRIADEIAGKVGIHADSDFRIRSGILYSLQQAGNNGHTYLPMQELLNETNSLLGVENTSIEKQILDLIMDKRLVVKSNGDNQNVYISSNYYIELNTARMLHDLNVAFDITPAQIAESIAAVQREEGFTLDETQAYAVEMSMKNGLFILTGGPGTGKTTTIRAMLNCFERQGLNILLAAPTGRAAKRMSEATGHEARTIHRMLEVNGMQGESSAEAHFARNEQYPLEADVVIIDEMSMVDIYLMHSLLCAVPVGTHLILVGDIDQLPSVGPGCVLRDIIESKCFPVTRLKHIFRQAAKSDIILNAHRINAQEPVDDTVRSKDFLFVKRQDANSIINAVITLVKHKLSAYVNASPYDIQILTPMKKGTLGVENLNRILQHYLNPPEKEKREKETAAGLLREGDKVMQIKNNYQLEWEIRGRYGIPLEKGLGIFNGDMGIIRVINSFSNELEVEFDENRSVVYSFKQMDELELAYAITIHKSQGSEYPAVVIPLLSGPRMLMTKNLLYTAITRAKACVCITGSTDSFHAMAQNTARQVRYSGLKERLKDCL